MIVRRILLLVFICALTVMCNELLPGCSSRAAPAPLERRKDRSLLGDWDMVWCGVHYKLTLSGGSHYGAGVNTSLWLGSWSYDGSTLVVHESLNNGVTWLVWSVKLDQNLSGVTDTGMPVRLSRPKR